MLPEFLAPRRPVRLDWPAKPPAPPRRWTLDWRTLVGGTGRTLIGAGLLLIGFVVYQLWGTGIQQARSQDQLEDRFTELLASASTGAPPSTTAPVTSVPAATTAVAGEPAPTAAATTSAPAAPAPTAARPVVREGQPIARIVIPSIGVDQVVVSGVSNDDLKKGPGHYPDTPLPGETGNVAIAGHRSTFGAPFERVDELEAGDEIVVTSIEGGRFVYRVTDARIVEPTEISVIGPSRDAVLTLTSCWPKFSADKRIVIRAALDPVAGQPARPAPATTAVPTVTTTPPVAGPTTTAATAVGGGAVTTLPVAVDARTADSIDAFQQGWWSDEGAWGDVVLWGFLLALVAVGAWRLSRRVQRNWFGLLIGIGPFVVVLYFFYENAARLLPANI